MPWRKYSPKKGRYGPIYYIAKGIQVRRDKRKKWTVFIEKNGKRINKTIGTGRDGLAKAVKFAEALSSKVESLDTVQPEVKANEQLPIFNNYAKQWLALNAKRWRDWTQIRYEEILRIHILPFDCFKKKISEIRRKDVKNHLRKVYQNRSPATVEAVHGVISGIFNDAIDDEMIDANPAAGLLKRILPPKNQRDLKDPDPFTIEERDLFLSHAETACTWTEQVILKTMLHAGLRLGETLAMRACNFSPDKMTYHVVESFKLKCFGKPKSGKSRFVDLPSFFVEELSDYISYLKKEKLKAGKSVKVDLLFIDPGENGDWPYSQRKIQGLVKKICKLADLRIRNPHDLRHTYATILLMAHQSPAYVQRQLGHHSISITVDCYGHWITGEGRDDLEKALASKKVVPNRVRKSHIIAYQKKGSQ